jgi:hypothetical protein
VDAGRRASRKAISSGTAVNASATLCKVSPSSATEPDTTTTTAWIAAVTASPARLSPQRSPTRAVGFQHAVDLLGRVVRVPAEQLGHCVPDPSDHRAAMTVRGVAVAVVAAPVGVCGVIVVPVGCVDHRGVCSGALLRPRLPRPSLMRICCNNR